MGAYKQAQIEEEDNRFSRMRMDDWPRCIRCTEPIDYEMVDLEDDGNVSEYQFNSMCAYCAHITSKDD